MLYSLARTLLLIYYSLFFRIKITGLGNLPKTGPIVVCSNHISNHDPLLLGAYLPRPVHFMAKHTLFKTWLLNKLLRGVNALPVNRDAADMQSLREGLAVLKDGGVLGIFAQGHRFKELDSKDAKTGVSLFALKSGAEVIPVKISPKYRIWGKVYISIGAPVDLSPFQDKKIRSDLLRQATDAIIERIAAL